MQNIHPFPFSMSGLNGFNPLIGKGIDLCLNQSRKGKNMNQDNTVETVETVTVAIRPDDKAIVLKQGEENSTLNASGSIVRNGGNAKAWKLAYAKKHGVTASQARKEYNKHLLSVAQENAGLIGQALASGSYVVPRFTYNPKNNRVTATMVPLSDVKDRVDKDNIDQIQSKAKKEREAAQKRVDDAKKAIEGVEISDPRLKKALELLEIL